MKYDKKRKEIKINRRLNKLDELALSFTRILKKHVGYVIISGYVSILLGRARATEDIDIFIKKIPKAKFSKLYKELAKNGFWCLNSESTNEIFNYLEEGLAVRFSKKGKAIPNFEIKFPKTNLERETFKDSINVKLPKGKLIISSLERQIAFKKYFLKAEKDFEDALHIEELFKNELNYKKINKVRRLIKKDEKS